MIKFLFSKYGDRINVLLVSPDGTTFENSNSASCDEKYELISIIEQERLGSSLEE